MNPEDAAKLIQQKLFETPGAVDEELIGACAELIGIDAVGKRVNFRKKGMSDRDRVALYCLGMRLLAYVNKEPELAQVNRKTLANELRLSGNLVAAHASRLINEGSKPLRSSKRGYYEAWIPAMKEFITEVNGRLAKQKE